VRGPVKLTQKEQEMEKRGEGGSTTHLKNAFASTEIGGKKKRLRSPYTEKTGEKKKKKGREKNKLYSLSQPQVPSGAKEKEGKRPRGGKKKGGGGLFPVGSEGGEKLREDQTPPFEKKKK